MSSKDTSFFICSLKRYCDPFLGHPDESSLKDVTFLDSCESAHESVEASQEEVKHSSHAINDHDPVAAAATATTAAGATTLSPSGAGTGSSAAGTNGVAAGSVGDAKKRSKPFIQSSYHLLKHDVAVTLVACELLICDTSVSRGPFNSSCPLFLVSSVLSADTVFHAKKPHLVRPQIDLMVQRFYSRNSFAYCSSTKFDVFDIKGIKDPV